MAAVANPTARVMFPLYWNGPESKGMVTSRAGATTRFGKVCAATTCTVMPDGLRAVSSDGFSGTGVVEPPLLKPWGLSANDTSPTFRPSTRSSVDGVSLPLGSRVSVATLVTAPIVSGPAVRALEAARPPGDDRPPRRADLRTRRGQAGVRRVACLEPGPGRGLTGPRGAGGVELEGPGAELLLGGRPGVGVDVERVARRLLRKLGRRHD